MTNPFRDQEKFMRACEQTVDEHNLDQFMMYVKLITEEVTELGEALAKADDVEVLDALIDILVVTIGAVHSLGADGEGAWKEVMGTNFANYEDTFDAVVQKRKNHPENTATDASPLPHGGNSV